MSFLFFSVILKCEPHQVFKWFWMRHSHRRGMKAFVNYKSPTLCVHEGTLEEDASEFCWVSKPLILSLISSQCLTKVMRMQCTLVSSQFVITISFVMLSWPKLK
jgi:hypothetical protein